MQDFTYHTHNNSQGIFDGKNSCEEMVSRAELLGFKTIGVSNHLTFHPNIPSHHKMFFNDIYKLIDISKRSFAEIDEVSSHHIIKVLKGFEVDFFPSSFWRNNFEKIITELKPDYVIGTTHFLCNDDETFMTNIYNLDKIDNQKNIIPLLNNYWNNQIEAVKSGYFDFMAHLDYCSLFGLGIGTEWNKIKHKLIETIIDYKQPFEINANGITQIGRPYPDWWIVEELIRAEVPTLISDDAHQTDKIGQHFSEVESKLADIGCKNRFSLL